MGLPGKHVQSRPLPRRSMSAIAIMYISSSLSETILFPFAAFMVAGFHITDDARKLGYYAGYLASSYYLGVLISSGFWGILSDHVGRKPVLLFSMLTNALAALAFGFSTSLPAAMAARFCNGIFSGIYPVGKTVVAELSDGASQAAAFAVIGLSWGIGLLLGPALGGLLCQPAEKFPFLFPPGSLLDHFPFALPCILVTLLSFLSLASLVFFLPETMGRAKATSEKFSQTAQEPGAYSAAEAQSSTNRDSSGKLPPAPSQEPPAGSSSSTESQLANSPVTAGSLKEPLIPKSGSAASGEASQSEPLDATLAKKGSASQLLGAIWQRDPEGKLGGAEAEDPGWLRTVFCERDTVVASLLYALLGFTATSQNEVFPIWCITPWALGGLGFGTSAVGMAQAAGGIALIPYQMFFYTPIANRLGTLRSFQWGVAGMALVAAYPAVRWLPNPTARVLAAMGIMMIRGVTAATAFTSVTIAINNSVRHPQHLGAVNGGSQMLNMGLESVAPVVGASLYAWSISAPHPFPLDYCLYWVLWALLCALMLLLSVLLPRSIDDRKFFVDMEGLQ